jgi:hypothetical protein
VNRHRYRRHPGNRRNAGRNPRERAFGKVIDYLFFVLPRLVFWYTVKFIAITLWNLTTLIATNVTRLVSDRQVNDTPAIASSPPADTVTEQFRAEKRRQCSSAMEDWDYEWGRLLDSGSDQPAEGVGVSPEQHEPVKEESSDEHVLNGPDEKLPEVRRAILHRFHADIVMLHEARVAQSGEDARPASWTEGQHKPNSRVGDDAVVVKRVHAGTGHTAPAASDGLLADDPRTMWAWADYLEGRLSLPVNDEAARQVLAAIPPGDHVEIFGAVAFGARLLGSKDTLPPEARFAARTFDRWILPYSGRPAEIIPASSTRHWGTCKPVYVARWMAQSNFTLANGRRLGAYSDRIHVDRFDEGAGLSILRLPDSPLAPAPPGLGTGGEHALVANYIDSVTDRVRKAQANYVAGDAWLALHETYGENKDRLSRAENYLKGAVDDIKRRPRIGAETHKAVVSHFRNADLKAAFFCIALGLPYPGDKPLSSARRRRPTAADFY